MASSGKSTPEPEIKSFKTQEAFEKWLSKNFEKQEGIFLQVFKKGSGIKSVTITEALDTALCYGWIDGIRKSYDETSYLQKYTPRRPRSLWSKVNVENISRLTAAGKMQPSGIAEVEKAKADGRWEKAYEPQREMQVPEDFVKLVSRHKKALVFFESLSRQNKFAIAFRLHTAKRPETREKRLQELVAMMKEGKKFY